jgi:hypothetical protein
MFRNLKYNSHFAAIGLIVLVNLLQLHVVKATTFVSQEQGEVDEGYETKGHFGGEVLPSSSFGNGAMGTGHRSLYMDPALVPYIHPKFVYEEEVPIQDYIPRSTKRTSKGMRKNF